MTGNNPIGRQREMEVFAFSSLEGEQADEMSGFVQQASAACAGGEGGRSADHISLFIGVQPAHHTAGKYEIASTGKTNRCHRFGQLDFSRAANLYSGKIQTGNMQETEVVRKAAYLRFGNPTSIAVRHFDTLGIASDMASRCQCLRGDDDRRSKRYVLSGCDGAQFDHAVSKTCSANETRYCSDGNQKPKKEAGAQQGILVRDKSSSYVSKYRAKPKATRPNTGGSDRSLVVNWESSADARTFRRRLARNSAHQMGAHFWLAAPVERKIVRLWNPAQ